MQIGYARVSTNNQTNSFRLGARRMAGCELTFSDHASGATKDRPALSSALSHAHHGDTLVVWRLDRLARSLPHLTEMVQRLEAAGVGLRSLTEGIDTTTPNGRLVSHLFGALAQFERELIRERSLTGLAVARARGRKGGRPPKLSAEKVRVATRLLTDPESTVSAVARTLGVHRSTLHKALHGAAVKTNGNAGRGFVQAR